jgi:hypothetical protein
MKRISSTSTALYKKGFPAIWFVFLGVMITRTLMRNNPANGGIVAVVVLFTMAVFGYVVMKRFVWDLADEVLDAGDHLVIRKGGREHHLPLTDIMNVSFSTGTNPPRITLKLTGQSSQGPLGEQVAFTPQQAFTLNPFPKNEVAEDLMVRVDNARSQRRV